MILFGFYSYFIKKSFLPLLCHIRLPSFSRAYRLILFLKVPCRYSLPDTDDNEQRRQYSSSINYLFPCSIIQGNSVTVVYCIQNYCGRVQLRLGLWQFSSNCLNKCLNQSSHHQNSSSGLGCVNFQVNVLLLIQVQN